MDIILWTSYVCSGFVTVFLTTPLYWAVRLYRFLLFFLGSINICFVITFKFWIFTSNERTLTVGTLIKQYKHFDTVSKTALSARPSFRQSVRIKKRQNFF